ncbi:histidine kinase [Pedobacter agri]|uniref:sensor histidine kinase n=1 Tax=Pedobacter agri TaxID=454586 RepID=UPI002930D69F|nr:histidine kinase [Pedobacter agri]
MLTQWNKVDDLLTDQQYIFRVLWRASQFLYFAAFFHLFQVYQREQKDKEKAKDELYQINLKTKNIALELTDAKNAHLRAQINPHLLFNTLNFVYQKVLDASPQAAEMVMTLSDLMHYSLDTKFFENMINLEEEIEQVNNLIKLHMMRFNYENYISFKYTEEIKSINFLPLILITFIENTLKHGKLNDKANPALIEIYTAGDLLKITTKNLIDHSKNHGGQHTGLSNTESRLKAIYGDYFKLDYRSDNIFFELDLEVKVK